MEADRAAEASPTRKFFGSFSELDLHLFINNTGICCATLRHQRLSIFLNYTVVSKIASPPPPPSHPRPHPPPPTPRGGGGPQPIPPRDGRGAPRPPPRPHQRGRRRHRQRCIPPPEGSGRGGPVAVQGRPLSSKQWVRETIYFFAPLARVFRTNGSAFLSSLTHRRPGMDIFGLIIFHSIDVITLLIWSSSIERAPPPASCLPQGTRSPWRSWAPRTWSGFSSTTTSTPPSATSLPGTPGKYFFGPCTRASAVR